jgi:hypothetical protein
VEAFSVATGSLVSAAPVRRMMLIATRPQSGRPISEPAAPLASPIGTPRASRTRSCAGTPRHPWSYRQELPQHHAFTRPRIRQRTTSELSSSP